MPFEARAPDVDELEQGPPDEVAIENAYRKAAAVAASEPGAVAGSEPAGPGSEPGVTVLGVDTIVTLEGRIYGKPRDREHAHETLAALSGQRHEVISGICLIERGRVRTAGARTRVELRSLDANAIDAYLDTGEWRGRAGAYAVQERGALLVRAIEGDYLGVVGLPVAALVELAPGLLGV
ncbi:MAG: Maf family protein [Solirubrobacteraceae bacterium]